MIVLTPPGLSQAGRGGVAAAIKRGVSQPATLSSDAPPSWRRSRTLASHGVFAIQRHAPYLVHRLEGETARRLEDREARGKPRTKQEETTTTGKAIYAATTGCYLDHSLLFSKQGRQRDEHLKVAPEVLTDQTRQTSPDRPVQARPAAWIIMRLFRSPTSSVRSTSHDAPTPRQIPELVRSLPSPAHARAPFVACPDLLRLSRGAASSPRRPPCFHVPSRLPFANEPSMGSSLSFDSRGSDCQRGRISTSHRCVHRRLAVAKQYEYEYEDYLVGSPKEV